VQLWLGRLADGPTKPEIEIIRERCNQLQSDMLAWEQAGAPAPATFDGTVASLINCYQTDKQSGYQKVRFGTRNTYDSLLKRIEQDLGSEQIANLDARRVMSAHEK